jgi:hypothetical protein
MIKYLIVMALFAAWCKLPSTKSKPKKSWKEEQKFAKDFDIPNESLDYSQYD